ncbi:hypothetical protein DCO58_03415 [Helicobacter saguini]|uniref:Uncharacterized protein n=1 Tax=Helicobacter saguini TaxID=1548018 RepID=A0A099B644_9HELI|nr:hypothetical protein [Helicobacter saguini]MWV62579.1 hypothetical protein [Helicobacter saguini]MWV66747.1 hypothetical protein [Helicobacter saguini]MWV69098.1 hypothetical protein [Helicobacter saguini]MWV71347.1 hypothetical protein [Helicobacter saguini]TLD91534.1 hypothetical protein LS64_011800 [Helicobacter saguini]
MSELSKKLGEELKDYFLYRQYRCMETTINENAYYYVTEGKIQVVENKVVIEDFKLESFAFAPKLNEPIKILSYEKSTNGLPIYNTSVISKLIILHKSNANIFKQNFSESTINKIQELILNAQVDENDKLEVLKLLFSVSDNNVIFFYSTSLQKEFYKKMQVFDTQKKIFESFLKSKPKEIDIIETLIYAFYPNANVEFTLYLLNKYSNAIVTTQYNIKNKIDSKDNTKEAQYEIHTPFRFIDILFAKALFSNRLDLINLLERYNVKKEVLIDIAKLNEYDIKKYKFDELFIIVENLASWDINNNPLKYILDKGINDKKLLEYIIWNTFIMLFEGIYYREGFILYDIFGYAMKYQDSLRKDEALGEDGKINLEYIIFTYTNIELIFKTLQYINITLRQYFIASDEVYPLLSQELYDLLTPIVSGNYDTLATHYKDVVLYLVKNFRGRYNENITSYLEISDEEEIKELEKIKENIREETIMFIVRRVQ